MANLQVKNVPDVLHDRIRRLAAREGKSVRDIVLMAVERELARAAWHERIGERSKSDLGESIVEALHEARRERDNELSQ